MPKVRDVAPLHSFGSALPCQSDSCLHKVPSTTPAPPRVRDLPHHRQWSSVGPQQVQAVVFFSLDSDPTRRLCLVSLLHRELCLELRVPEEAPRPAFAQATTEAQPLPLLQVAVVDRGGLLVGDVTRRLRFACL